MATTLDEIIGRLPQERQERIQARADEIRLEEATLGMLRKRLGLSQEELGKIIGDQQPAVSKLEGRENFELNTLRAVVAALGGTMDIIIRVPNKEPVLLTTPVNQRSSEA